MLRSAARLLGLGTATPETFFTQPESIERLARIWKLDAAAHRRFERIALNCGIERRHIVRPPEEAVRLTTGERMQAYAKAAPDLAATAAARALSSIDLDPGAVTDLVVVSCTGFSAPGVDVELVERLGLARSVRRTGIGFMGCFGGISGLRTAAATAGADPAAVVLVVCIELCSLHGRDDADPQNQVASALFADGAAAAVVAGATAPVAGEPIGGVDLGLTTVVPEARSWMTWTISDAGFVMTLDRRVPEAIREVAPSFLARAAGDGPPLPALAVHPGGPDILRAVAGAAPNIDITASESVLRSHGNMSSATILFVLEALHAGGASWPCLLLAFGPGLTVEGLRIHPVR